MQITKEDYRLFKPLLFSISYRMLGSVAEAEDVVQETFLKAFQINEENITSKKAYLCKMATNLSLDLLRSARYKRENYIGPWNPEPLFIEKLHAFDPSEKIIQQEGLSVAYLRMMEHLSPMERAIFLLREAFDFSHAEIGQMLEKKEDNCRKIFSRAKQKVSLVEGESLHYEMNKSLVNRFIEAFQTNNMDDLLELISAKVTLFSDGGGKVHAAVRPVISLTNVLALLYGVVKKAPEDTHFQVANVNCQPAIVVYMNGKLQSTLSFYICNDKIEEMYITMNPEKLPT